MMASNEHRKQENPPTLSDYREGRRKVAKVRSGEVRCPICEVTLWPGKVEQHYKQELAKLNTAVPSLAHSKKRRASANTGEGRENKLFQRAHKILESVKRRQILFDQYTTSHLSSEAAGPSSGHSRSCPVCSCPLPLEESAAETHVNACLGVAEQEGGDSSSDSEVYEEYTWCNVTRVRATSMLTPQARANMFDGTIISKGNSSQGDDSEMVDVEDDETAVYGPPQYGERDVHLSMQAAKSSEVSTKDGGGEGDSTSTSREPEEDKVKSKLVQPRDQLQCLICMDNYREPLVSVKCWHVYCEQCWLQALGSKKVCPKCKDITSTSDLRKIFL